MAHGHHQAGASLNRLAFAATLHCLTGCGIGEVLGLAVAMLFGWDTGRQIRADRLLDKVLKRQRQA